MNQGIIDLLEVRYETAVDGFNDKFVYLPVDDAKRILDYLKQQPPAGDFTENLRKFVKLYENEVPRRAEITFLEEACEIIDKLLKQPPAGEFTKRLRDNVSTTDVEGVFVDKLHWPSIKGDILEACVIIDRVEAENKELLAACELALHNEHKRWAEIKAVLVAAIDKAKKEGVTK